MPARSFAAFTFLALSALADPLTAQETNPSEAPARPTRWTLFTAEALDRAEAIAAERRSRRESYIRAAEVDDDVIVLAPYIVEGDDSLLMARLRRDLERGSLVRERRRAQLPAAVLQDLNFRRKFDNQFFDGPSPGAPADRPQSGNLLGIGAGIFRALLEGRADEIFRDPER